MKTVQHEKPGKKTPTKPAGKTGVSLDLQRESPQTCERCGGTIGEDHRESFPGTRLCHECQSSLGPLGQQTT